MHRNGSTIRHLFAARAPGAAGLVASRPSTVARAFGAAAPVVAVALAAGLFASCAHRGGNQGDATSLPAATVKTITVKSAPLTPEIVSFGSISYRTETTISASVEGTVAEIAAHEGDPVYRGQLLARLSNVQLEIGERQAESQLASAKAAVEVAKAQLWQGKEQVQARILSLKKMVADIAQKKREAANLETTLLSREKVFKVGGISSEQLESLKLQYQSAETAYENAENDYEVSEIGLRDEDIRDSGFAVPASAARRTALLVQINTQTLQAQLDAALAGVKTAQSNLDAAKALVAQLTIDSPVSGVIGAREASVGEHLSVGGKIFTLIEDSEVYAVFPVPEAQAMSIAEGMPVEVTVPALGDRLFHSRISVVSPLVDPQSGNLTVRALLPNSDSRLKPGLFIRVRVQTGETRRAMLLPRSAFASLDSGKGVLFAVRDGRAFERKVSVVESAPGLPAGRVEVTRGLTDGERVVDEPSPVLQDGEKVDVEG